MENKSGVVAEKEDKQLEIDVLCRDTQWTNGELDKEDT